jgi:GcrA cell cycle regulator
VTDFAWNDETIAALGRHWRDGCSAAICAVKLGDQFGTYPTRSAVIGKVHRTKLNQQYPRSTQIVRRRQHPRPPRLERVRVRIKPPASVKKPAVRRRAVVVAPPPIPEPTPVRVALVDLQTKHCRWPLGDPLARDFAFCGCDRPMVMILGKPEFDPTTHYCEFHEERARA